MKTTLKALFGCLVAVALYAPARAQDQVKGMAVAYPFAFQDGGDTSRKTALDTVDEITRKAGYSTAPRDVAEKTWGSLDLKDPSAHDLPSKESLQRFGQKMDAALVIYGSISWHTRSIWVGAGPKTISTATVNVHILDVASGHEVFKRTDVEGRSDERENMFKVAADVLVTPIVSAVSGGPATPREQRAVQIALARAMHDWVKRN